MSAARFIRLLMLHAGIAALAAILAWAPEALSATISSRAPGIVIHDADETLARYCRFEDGLLWLVLPSGSRFELVTSTADPSITKPGDGSFHSVSDRKSTSLNSSH